MIDLLKDKRIETDQLQAICKGIKKDQKKIGHKEKDQATCRKEEDHYDLNFDCDVPTSLASLSLSSLSLFDNNPNPDTGQPPRNFLSFDGSQ